METRARYALIGAFILAVIVAGFGFVYWLENSGALGQRTVYQVRFEGPVSGLLIGSPVLFNGIRVGEVTELALVPDKSEETKVTISVDTGTPIRSDSKIAIESQGFTSSPALALRGGTSDAAPPPVEDGVQTLVAPPDAGRDWTVAARDTLTRMDKVIADNEKPLHDTITNLDIFSETLARNSDRLDGLIGGLESWLGTSTAKVVTYDLRVPASLPKLAEAPRAELIVPEPITSTSLGSENIFLKTGDDEAEPLPSAKWSDMLPAALQKTIIEAFEDAGYISSVNRPAENLVGGYQLLIGLRDFQLATSPEPTAEIAFTAKIEADGKIIGAKLFKASAPAQGTDAPAAVAALNDGLGKVLNELLTWTAETLSTAPPLLESPASTPEATVPAPDADGLPPEKS
jgi:phospholipid/cholesterol/gamma-HCH transport system substrate-binding protein